MKITHTTLQSALARALGERLDPGMPMSHHDLVQVWRLTGLRTDDLEKIIEHLYALRWLDRTVVDGQPWYRLTPAGAIGLRLCRESFWASLRDRLTLMRLQLRRRTPPRPSPAQGRRRADRIACDTS
ncbi:hypothetical protein SAMN04488120_10291 [Fontimonas thermophila]|uniref:Uncharacterized protein n=1 Tax=Fontimonas thermophila TaxID=1076937 RepID=A0A1I2HR15_9GAMM|nr:hypothetical protein [Fontimonas thermophila]SFF31186.1 hypothetical protein SAMN04488120_10291 [Fontimonas thermophila]